MKTKLLANLLALLAIFTVVYAVFGGTVDYEFVDWDDPWLITRNPIVSRPSAASAATILTDLSPETRRLLGKEYLPLRDLSFMASYASFGANPAGFHIVNLNVYVLCCFALFLLLLHYASGPAAALGAALLFVLHPAHAETVAWISERKSPLSLLFLLAGVLAYLRAQDTGRRRWLAAAAGAFSCAVLTKSTAIVFLPLAWLLAELRGRRMARAHAAAFAVQTAAHLALAVGVGARLGMVKSWMGGSPLSHALTIPYLWLKYAGLLLFPTEVRTLYEIAPAGLADPRPWIAAALFGLALAAAWRRRATLPEAPVLFALFAVALLPVLQLVPIPNRFSARYLFVASIVLPLAFVRAEKRLREERRAALLVLALAWGAGAFYVLRNALPRWQDCRALWTEASAHPAQKAYALTNLFKCHKNSNRPREALAAADVLFALDPAQPKVWTDVGSLRLAADDFGGARAAFARAHEFHRDADERDSNLAVVDLREGRLAEAEALLEGVVRRNPAYAPAYRNLVSLARARGDARRAAEYSHKARAMVHR